MRSSGAPSGQRGGKVFGRVQLSHTALIAIFARALIFHCHSCNLDLNMDYLISKIWEYLALLRVYTKKRGEQPDFSEPVILRSDSTVRDVCHAIHRNLVGDFKAALVWVGTLVPQEMNVPTIH